MAKPATEKQKAEAIRMKYDGAKHEEIAKKLHLSVGAIHNWFMKDGLLYDAYHAYVQDRQAEVENEIRSELQRTGHFATKMLIALMGHKSGTVQLGAVNSVLDRLVGKPKQPVAVEPKSDDPDSMSFEEELALIKQTYGKSPAPSQSGKKK
jgi:transposase